MLRTSAVDRLALLAIRAYQCHVSPRKGFCCAWRCHTGGSSCSQLGLRAIRRFGLWGGLPILRRRLERCGIAHRRFSRSAGPLHRQAGFCDLPCDLPCDGGGLDCAGAGCDALSGCGGPCDCGDWRRGRKSSDEEQYVYIPPDTSRHRRPDSGGRPL